MSKRPFGSRLTPLGNTILVRKEEAKVPEVNGRGPLLVAEKDDAGGLRVTQGLSSPSRSVVVAVGPGEWNERGIFEKPDERIRPGVTVLADARAYMQFSDVKEMKSEGLYFLPGSLVLFILEPEGLHRAVVEA